MFLSTPRAVHILLSLLLISMITPRLFASDESETKSGPVVITRGPYLQTPTENSIIIRWRTDTPTNSRVRFGSAVGNLTGSVDDLALTTEHAVHLENLSSDTKYFYSVGTTTQELAGNDPDHHFTTSPPTGTATPFRVWVIGDSGTGNDDARAVRDAYLEYAESHPSDLWLTLGDNAYALGSDIDYQRAFFEMYPSVLRTTPVWSTVGNHDAFSADSPTQSGPYFDIFSFPTNAQAGGTPSGTEAYYSFDYANVHFVCLDTSETDFSIGSPMLTWLATDLASTSQEWLIAFFHHPPYSDGHDSDVETDLIEIRENIVPMLESSGVDLVLTGHSHSYERTVFLNGHYGLSTTLNPTMIIDGGDGQEDGDGAYTKPAGLSPNSGTVYAVAGHAGQLTGTGLNHPAMHTSAFVYGSMVLDINRNRLDAIALTSEGIINDRFTILKATGCIPDMNNDGTLDFFDVSQFLTYFTKQNPLADLSGDDNFDFFDVSAFLVAYAKGCP